MTFDLQRMCIATMYTFSNLDAEQLRRYMVGVGVSMSFSNHANRIVRVDVVGPGLVLQVEDKGILAAFDLALSAIATEHAAGVKVWN